MQKSEDNNGPADVGGKSAAMHKRAKREREKREKENKQKGKGKAGPLSKYGKLLEDDEDCVLPTIFGRIIAKSVNLGYNIFMMVNGFSRKLLWFGSCIGFMWIFPVTFELF